jgi:surface antigen
MPISLKLARSVLLALVVAWAHSVLADPPPHAPAHGWRKKHDARYIGYSGREWEHDYGVVAGRCNRQAIATVVGGVVGGAIASRVATEHRAVATIIGAAAGAFIGNRIGRKLDDADARCMGHALELGVVARPVAWVNEATGVHYELVPGAKHVRSGSTCREFMMRAVDGRNESSRAGVACQAEPGVWDILR